MHVVTKIEEFQKKRNKIYIDHEFAFVLYKGELRLYRIEEGKEISEETIANIKQVVLPKRAKLRCLNLLQKKEYTRGELVRKLKTGFYTNEIIDVALAYVESYGYVDDSSYVKRYIECKSVTRSKRKIRLELKNKGITKECMDAVYEKIDDTVLKKYECEAIIKELKKRKYIDKEANFEERQKVISFLCKKGYTFAFVKDVLNGNYLT